MKNILLLLLCAAALGWAACSDEGDVEDGRGDKAEGARDVIRTVSKGDEFTLRREFTKGETFSYRIELKVGIKVRESDEDQDKQDMEMFADMDMTVRIMDVDDEGVATMQISLQRIAAQGTLPGWRPVPFDFLLSEDEIVQFWGGKDYARGSHARELRQLIDQPILVLKMTPEGDVVNFDMPGPDDAPREFRFFRSNTSKLLNQINRQKMPTTFRLGETSKFEFDGSEYWKGASRVTLADYGSIDGKECVKLVTEVTLQGVMGGSRRYRRAPYISGKLTAVAFVGLANSMPLDGDIKGEFTISERRQVLTIRIDGLIARK